MRAMLVYGLKSVEKLDHENGKNPVYTIHYPDLTSGTVFCLGFVREQGTGTNGFAPQFIKRSGTW